MRLARFGVGHQERCLDGGIAVVGLLGELHVVADYLVAKHKPGTLGIRLYDLAVLPDLESAGFAIGQQVALVGSRLLDGIGAVRQLVGSRLGDVCPEIIVPSRLDGFDYIARIEE